MPPGPLSETVALETLELKFAPALVIVCEPLPRNPQDGDVPVTEVVTFDVKVTLPKNFKPLLD